MMCRSAAVYILIKQSKVDSTKQIFCLGYNLKLQYIAQVMAEEFSNLGYVFLFQSWFPKNQQLNQILHGDLK